MLAAGAGRRAGRDRRRLVRGLDTCAVVVRHDLNLAARYCAPGHEVRSQFLISGRADRPSDSSPGCR